MPKFLQGNNFKGRKKNIQIYLHANLIEYSNLI